MSCKIGIFQMLDGMVWGREVSNRTLLVPSDRNPIWTSRIKGGIYSFTKSKSWSTKWRERQESSLTQEHLRPETQILVPSLISASLYITAPFLTAHQSPLPGRKQRLKSSPELENPPLDSLLSNFKIPREGLWLAQTQWIPNSGLINCGHQGHT